MSEQKLWEYVLLQAFDDIKAGLTKHRSWRRDKDQHRAVAYIFSGQCDDRVGFAGFDASYIREKVLRKSIKGDDGWRRSRETLAHYYKFGEIHPDCHRLYKKLMDLINQMPREERERVARALVV